MLVKSSYFYLPKNVCQSQIYFLKFDLRHIDEIRDFHNKSILFLLFLSFSDVTLNLKVLRTISCLKTSNL